MTEPVRLALPADRDALAALRCGQEVLVTGTLFTARDATHALLAREVQDRGALPFGLAGQALFYAGPTAPSPGRPAGSVGPTTASRMDAWTPDLLAAGVRVMLGKGPRSEEVRAAIVEQGAVYLVAVGGAAALLGAHVVSADVVGYGELGPEALMRLEVRDLPAFVGIDAEGGDLFSSEHARWRLG